MRAPNNKPTEKTKRRIKQERKRLLRNKMPPQTPSQTPSEPSQYVEMDFNNLVQSMLDREEIQKELTKEATKRLDTQQSIEIVKNILSEYFTSFLVLGYGVDGNRVIIKNTITDMDEDSLIEMLRYVFMRMINNG